MAPVRKEYSTVRGKSKERIRNGANPLEHENAYKNVSKDVKKRNDKMKRGKKNYYLIIAK